MGRRLTANPQRAVCAGGYRLNNIAKAEEHPDDELRVDIVFLFAYQDIAGKEHIARRLHEAFPNKLISVRFADGSNKHVVVRVKANGRGVPRFEVVNFAENGFT